jgi:Domain of unknown function (DUF1707)/Cell wall-active antibiotics response 4TMS YvqF
VSEPPAIRVSDAEREQAALELREHCVAGRLTLEELSERLDETYAARSREELEQVTRELPPATVPARRRRFSMAVFGNVERRGRFRLGRRTYVLSTFADIDLDLRAAQLTEPETTVIAFALFGNVDVYVPEGVQVDVTGAVVFGHARDRGHDPPVHPGAPRIHIVLLGLFGTLDVWRLPRKAVGSYQELIRLAKRRHRGELEA